MISRREKTGAPERRALGRLRGADDDEAGQVLVFAAEPVVKPRAHAWSREGLLAGIHLQASAVVIDVVGDHAADDAHVVDAGGKVRQKFADFRPALAVFLE